MKQRTNWDMPSCLSILLISFLIGGFFGFLFSTRIVSEGEGSLAHFFQDYFRTIETQTLKSNFLLSVWTNLKIPLYTFLFGFSLLGTLGIPLLLAMEGFFFTFPIATLCRLFGVQGIVPSFFLFCIPTLLQLPVLLLLGIQSVRSAHLLWQRAKPEEFFPSGSFTKLSFSLFLVCLSIAFDYCILPLLLEAVLPFMVS